MPELMSLIKKGVTAPKIYSLIVRTPHSSLLHIGVYTSLDDAFASAKKEFWNFLPPRGQDRCELETWAVIGAEEVITALCGGIPNVEDVHAFMKPVTPEVEKPKTTGDVIKSMKQQKNELIQKIIETKDTASMRRAKGILTKNEIAFIADALSIKTK